MRTFLTIIIVFASAMTAHGESRWISLAGPWEADDPNDMAVGYMGSVSYVYAIGGLNRGLLVSNNEGNKWRTLPMNEVVAIACVKYAPLEVYAARQQGAQYIVSKSVDGGVTWIEERGFDSPVSKIVISPENSNVVYIGLGGEQFDVNRPLWRSVDGGGNWKEVTSFDVYAKITQIAFDAGMPSIMYVTTRGTMGGIWKSVNGGTTWSQRNNGMSNVQIASFGITSATQNSILYAGTYEHAEGDSRIYSSTDGGDHWIVSVNTSGATDIAVDPVRSNLAYAATTGGVLCTKDFGGSWVVGSKDFVSKSGRRIGVVHVGIERVQVLLGTRSAFYRSDDYGEHWDEKTSGMALVSCYGIAVNSAGLFSVAFGGRENGSFVNHGDGSIWNVIQDNSIFNSPIGSVFYGFAIAASQMHSNVLLASGTNDENLAQMLFRSSDAGITWEKVYNNDFANQPCNIIFDPNDDRFVYTADLDHVLKSSDGGVTWNSLPNSPPYVYSIAIAPSRDPASTTLYAGGGLQVYKSEDAGKTWLRFSTGLPSPVISIVCDPVDRQTVFAGTNRNRIYRTTDGGSTWHQRSEGVYGNFIQSIVLGTTKQALYACAADYEGAPTRIYRSSNFGETWRDVSDGLNGAVVYELLVYKDNASPVCCSTNRGVFRFSEDNIVATRTASDLGGWPLTFKLNQNYPNPFNPSTVIKFEVPTSKFVVLKVFDVLGKEVKTLVSEELKAGSYEKTFDANGLASGVYFYRLQAGAYIETKKLLLLR